MARARAQGPRRAKLPEPKPHDLGRLAEIALSLALETASDLATLGRVSDLKVAGTRMQLAVGAAQAIEGWIRAEQRKARKAKVAA